MQLFCDLDGVLADLAAGYWKRFGVRITKAADNADWDAVRSIPNFYRDLPPMGDAFALWNYIKGYNPPILTGVPKLIPEAAGNKRAWVDRNLGKHVPMIACRAKEKSLHMKPGDVMIDDWDKYRHLWIEKGGHWITHTSAAETICQLKQMGL